MCSNRRFATLWYHFIESAVTLPVFLPTIPFVWDLRIIYFLLFRGNIIVPRSIRFYSTVHTVFRQIHWKEVVFDSKCAMRMLTKWNRMHLFNSWIRSRLFLYQSHESGRCTAFILCVFFLYLAHMECNRTSLYMYIEHTYTKKKFPKPKNPEQALNMNKSTNETFYDGWITESYWVWFSYTYTKYSLFFHFLFLKWNHTDHG